MRDEEERASERMNARRTCETPSRTHRRALGSPVTPQAPSAEGTYTTMAEANPKVRWQEACAARGARRRLRRPASDAVLLRRRTRWLMLS